MSPKRTHYLNFCRKYTLFYEYLTRYADQGVKLARVLIFLWRVLSFIFKMTLERSRFLYFCGKLKFLNIYVSPGTKGLKKEPQIFMFPASCLTVLAIYLWLNSNFCGHIKIKIYMYIYIYISNIWSISVRCYYFAHNCTPFCTHHIS